MNELSRLAEVLNSTFARLESAFAQQKQFTADASHELRTPLAVIISESQSALNRPRSNEEYQEALAVCHDSAQQMRALADSLLQLARFDAGQEEPDQTPVDLGQIAGQCAGRVLPLAREKAVVLETACEPAPASGDAIRLSQVIANLLQNAIHYNKTGGRVFVKTFQEGGAAVVTVSDTGVGIAAEDLPHIFERFYRADKARARTEGHTGLGLAIAKSIVEMHHGSITAESSPGEGTIFCVRVPSVN